MDSQRKADPSPPSLRLWLCPHRSLSINSARKIFSSTAPNTIRLIPHCHPTTCHSDITTLVETSDASPPFYTLRTFISLITIGTTSSAKALKSLRPTLPKFLIKQLLPHLNIPICRHLSLSNNAVAHIYKPRRVTLMEEEPIYRFCRPCTNLDVGSGFAFVENPYPHIPSTETNPTFNLAIEIVRSVGTLSDPTDPHWNLRALPPDMDSLADRWSEWLAESGRLMQDYFPRHSGDTLKETQNSKTGLGLSRCERLGSCFSKLKPRALLPCRRGRVTVDAEKARAGHEDEDEERPLLAAESNVEDTQEQKHEPEVETEQVAVAPVSGAKVLPGKGMIV